MKKKMKMNLYSHRYVCFAILKINSKGSTLLIEDHRVKNNFRKVKNRFVPINNMA